MYNIKANEKIATDSDVLKALKKLDDLQADVMIKRGDKSKQEPMFICKISCQGIVRVAGGEKPSFAAKNCMNDFLDAYRKAKKTVCTKRISAKRSGIEKLRDETAITDEEGVTAD